jgi:hypothetical protein
VTVKGAAGVTVGQRKKEPRPQKFRLRLFPASDAQAGFPSFLPDADGDGEILRPVTLWPAHHEREES